ncbi:NADP-dependent oxidoreductase [Microbacterium sp. 18062]|uniref:NADP-dependent oxidoreductase n=1 Tax=Microbacterium sp. 18062 TaxID=2681410 RepID=UPI00135BFCDE|nr:NADP-dependent oxidoreductase [Microbacterium sp. 18062]
MTVAVLYDETGDPGVLRLAEVPDPVAGAGEVVLRVKAVGINPFDAKVRAGAILLSAPFPRGIGGDVAGIVVAVGEGASYVDGAPVGVGDEVLGFGSSTLRGLVAVPAAHLARRPAALPWAVAGALATPGLTAEASYRVLEPAAGDTVFVSAAAGSVGFLYGQLALAAGARVIGSASSANHERLRAAGIEPVEYGPGLAGRLRSLAPEGITAVQDDAGGETVEVALELGVPPERICEIVDHAATERLGLASPGRYERRPDILERLAQQVAGRILSLPVQREFPLHEVAEAFALLETRHLSGKVVVTP